MLLIIYWAMTLCCCLYAAITGGRPERLGAGLIVCVTVVGFYIGLMEQRSWGQTVYPLLILDLICLLGFVTIALTSDRWWPLWTSACALIQVATHLASIAQIGVPPAIYHGLKGLWAIPMQLFMVRGITLDARYRSFSDRRIGNAPALQRIWPRIWPR